MHEDLKIAEKLKVLIVLDVLPERNGVGTFYTDLREYLEKYLKLQFHFCLYYTPV